MRLKNSTSLLKKMQMIILLLNFVRLLNLQLQLRKRNLSKKTDLSKRALKKIELSNEIITKGGSLTKEAAEYKVTELRKMLLDLSPKKKKGSKSKKTVTAETDHEALLATLANSLKSVEQNEIAKVTEVAKVYRGC